MKRQRKPALNSKKTAMLFGFSLVTLAAVLCFTLPLFQRKIHISPKNQAVKPVSFNPSPRFEKNIGQTDPEVDFLCRGKNHILYLTSTGSVLQLMDGGENRRSVPLRMELVSSNATSSAKGYDKLKSISNYYTGGDPDSWLTGVPNYARAGYDDVYPGIDMIYYFSGGDVEFDFVVDPGADPNRIRLSFSGTNRFKKDVNGNLAVSAGGHELVFHKPSAWQKLNGLKREVDVQFAVRDAGSVQFDIGPYDRSGTLTIDPQIIYATYLGGSKSDAGNGIAVDKYGCAYVTGSTSSTDFPKKNAYQSGLGSGSTYSDIFVTKMNPEGNDIIYSTYLGGRYNEGGDAIAVDTRCRACITGRTGSGAYDSTPESERFPLKNALRRITGDSQNAFVSVLDSTGGLFYSTYLGGEYEDWGEDIAVDASGCVYVTGTAFSYTPEFPIKNAFMSKKPSYYFDAFMTKIDPSKSGDESLVYSTYLGGDGDDYGYGIAVDGNGCAYVTGQATPNFPVKNAIQPEYKGKGDIFITKIDTKKSGAESLVYSTYLGDNASNSGAAIEVDASGCAYVSGSAAIPATPGTFSNTSSSFICKLNASGNGFVYLAHVLSGNCLALDADGNVYTVLITDLGKGRKVLALNADGTDTLFTQRTTVGTDLAVDADGAVHVVGSTNAADLPTTNPYQKNLAGSYDAFVEKWNPKEMLVVKVLSDPVDQEPHPIRNTAVDVYSIDMSHPASPFAFLTRKTTDKKGLLKFPVGQAYQPGMPIFIRTTPERKPAVKLNRTDKTSCMYKVHVDNLDFDADGIVTARYLKPDSKDTTDMYMDHTSLAFSLVVSIEWLASPDYIENLKSAFRKMNNILYDVTNGQAFIDTVAIYDGYDNWENADIRIYANNIQWPQAHPDGISYPSVTHLFLPPVFYSGLSDSTLQIQSIFDADQLDPSVVNMVTTMVHEFGHYALGFDDEYKNILRENIFPNINFGFMDSQYDLTDPFSTEMSDYRPGDSRFDDYSQTFQYRTFNSNCWDRFKLNYDHSYGDVVASMHRPRDFGVFPNDVMEGPNSDLENPDFSVGDMMGFEIKAVTTTQPRMDYLFIHPETRLPVPGAMVGLRKAGDWVDYRMVHGATTTTGRIKLFNVESGDLIYATHNKADQNWLYIETLALSALSKAGSDATTIEMKTVNGRFSLLSAFGFDAAGKPLYQCQADPAFASPPSIGVFDDVSVSEKQVLSASAGTYSAALNKPDFTEGSVVFYAPDSLGEEFFVSQNASVRNVSELGNSYYFPGMQTNLDVNSSETTAEKVALLASGFPAPMTGLPDLVRRVSDVIALNAYPEGSVFKGLIQIHYYADSLVALVPEAMILYKWENGWVPLATGVDLVHNTVAATINGPGIFAAFLDLTRSRVTGVSKGRGSEAPTGWMLYPNYPNPFNPSTRIRYDVSNRSTVKIEVFDLLGRKIRTLADHMHVAGSYLAEWDGQDDNAAAVPAGIYVCRIQTAQFVQSRKMVLIR